MDDVVERVLIAMRQRLGEQLTLDDLAQSARFSKYYFARMFRDATGLPPRRFLYALRLQEAKRMLVSTSQSVAAISNGVGYSSVGTFTSRFTASVGVSPAEYRRLAGDVSQVLPGEPPDPAAPGRITGRVEEPDERLAGSRAAIGLFRQPVPEGRPARYETLDAPGDLAFQNLPEGQWYVFAVAMSPADGRSPVLPGTPWVERVGRAGPVSLCPEASTAIVTVRLRPMRVTDPPFLAGPASPPAQCL